MRYINRLFTYLLTYTAHSFGHRLAPHQFRTREVFNGFSIAHCIYAGLRKEFQTDGPATQKALSKLSDVPFLPSKDCWSAPCGET